MIQARDREGPMLLLGGKSKRAEGLGPPPAWGASSQQRVRNSQGEAGGLSGSTVDAHKPERLLSPQQDVAVL